MGRSSSIGGGRWTYKTDARVSLVQIETRNATVTGTCHVTRAAEATSRELEACLQPPWSTLRSSQALRLGILTELAAIPCCWAG